MNTKHLGPPLKSSLSHFVASFETTFEARRIVAASLEKHPRMFQFDCAKLPKPAWNGQRCLNLGSIASVNKGKNEIVTTKLHTRIAKTKCEFVQ